MKTLFKKPLIALAAALPVLLFVSCTTDLPPQVITANGDVYSVEEFEELESAGLVDEMGNVIDTTLKKPSSSSDSSGSAASSSSTAASSASENASSASEDVSSSSEAEVESSSSEEEEEDDEDSSSSVAEESSSSYEAVFGTGEVGESIIAKDGKISIGTDAMVEVDDADKDALNEVKAALDASTDLPDGYSKFTVETTFEDYNYESNIETAYFCLTKDGSWLEISSSKLGENIPHFRNNASLGPLESFTVSFADACSAVCTREK